MNQNTISQGGGNPKSQTSQGIGTASNISMIVFFSLYLIIWVFVSVFMIKISPKSPCSVYLIILLNIGICICFLLCIFYSPWNHSLHNKILKSKQKYDKIKKDTELPYQQQIKVFWLNDLNQQTQYYLYAYMLLSFLPFFYLLIILLANKFILNDYNTVHLFIVKFSLFYTGLQLLIYSIAKKQWWNIIIPIILFLFMIMIIYFKFIFSLYKTIEIVTLSVITSIVQLKMSSPLGLFLSFWLCFGMFILIVLT